MRISGRPDRFSQVKHQAKGAARKLRQALPRAPKNGLVPALAGAAVATVLLPGCSASAPPPPTPDFKTQDFAACQEAVPQKSVLQGRLPDGSTFTFSIKDAATATSSRPLTAEENGQLCKAVKTRNAAGATDWVASKDVDATDAERAAAEQKAIAEAAEAAAARAVLESQDDEVVASLQARLTSLFQGIARADVGPALKTRTGLQALVVDVAAAKSALGEHAAADAAVLKYAVAQDPSLKPLLAALPEKVPGAATDNLQTIERLEREAQNSLARSLTRLTVLANPTWAMDHGPAKPSAQMEQGVAQGLDKGRPFQKIASGADSTYRHLPGVAERHVPALLKSLAVPVFQKELPGLPIPARAADIVRNGFLKGTAASEMRASLGALAVTTRQARADEQSRELMAAMERISGGERPSGWCLRAVQDAVRLADLPLEDHVREPRAVDLGRWLANPGNAASVGLKRLQLDNPYDAPPGSIVFIRPGHLGMSSSAGDVAVAMGHGRFLNDGVMGWGSGSSSFPNGNDHVLGIYIANGLGA